MDLISEDFHSAKQRLNPGNNSLREIPIKETVALPSEQFYLTTELTNVVGTSYIFVTSFGRYPCRRWYAFSSGKFSVHRLRNSFSVPKFLFGTHNASAALAHRLSVDSQTTVICNQPCPLPIFVHSSLGLCCISHDHRHFLPPVRIALL